MEATKVRECTYCHGRGWIGSDMFDRKDCQYCNGRGTVPVKEKRKSLLVTPRIHATVKDLAYEHKMTVTAFIGKIVEEYQEKYINE